MTYGVRNIVGVLQVHKGGSAPKGLIFSGDNWPAWLTKLYDYLLGCHYGHFLDFLVALACWTWLFPITFPHAHEWRLHWVLKVVAFNLACEVIFYGFWHHVTYASEYARGALKKMKYNVENQYESDGRPVGYISSTSGQLQREVLLTTLGWLQSSLFQCVMMWLWASGRLPYYADFWSNPMISIGGLLFVTYWYTHLYLLYLSSVWREFHFYWVHRAMHPWWDRKNGLAQGDIGAFLYRWVHSLHHKSHNPGPFSGLAMHPVEHLLYYTCTLLCLFYRAHPLHFLYAKFHADIAPIGGHDGYATPGGGGDFHWLHHARLECNYGVPLVDFDRLFGTWVDYDEWRKHGGSLKAVKEARAQKAHKAN